MAKKTYVIDTSAFLTDADCIYNFKNNDIVVPLKVLEEIDNHKKRQDGVGVNARKIIRTFDQLRVLVIFSKAFACERGKVWSECAEQILANSHKTWIIQLQII